MKRYLAYAAVAALFVLPAAALAQDAGASSTGTGAPGAAASPAQPMAKPARGAMRRAGAQRNLTAQQFARVASQGGMFEVQSSQIALQKSQNADVKTFAQRMIDDHTKANDQLKQLSEQEHLRVPARLNKRNAGMIDDLQKASGAAFDAAYLRDQRTAHRVAIRVFQGYADNGDQPALKDWAKSTLPTLEEHEKMLMDIRKAS